MDGKTEARPPVQPERPLGTQDAAYQALHAEREGLERALTLSQQQQRFGTEPGAIAAAHDRETGLLKDLDRVLTQIRAVEVRRRPGARRW